MEDEVIVEDDVLNDVQLNGDEEEEDAVGDEGEEEVLFFTPLGLLVQVILFKNVPLAAASAEVKFDAEFDPETRNQ